MSYSARWPDHEFVDDAGKLRVSKLGANLMKRRIFLACAGVLATAMIVSPQALAQKATVTARVGVIPIIGTAPLFVAQNEGWLKQAGLDLTVTTFESGPNMIQALASGTIDIYVAGVAPLAVARSKGIDVASLPRRRPAENVFVASPKLAKYFTSGTSPAAAFKSYRAAEGKPARLATQPAGSVPNTTLQYWLWEEAKADKADVEVVPMGIDATQQAILAGAVEGATIREPAVTIVQGRNPGNKLVALGDEMFPGQPGTVVAVSGAFLEQNPDAVQSLVSGLVKAADLLAKTPDEPSRRSRLLSARASSTAKRSARPLPHRRPSSRSILARSSSRRASCRLIRSSSARSTRSCRSKACSSHASTSAPPRATDLFMRLLLLSCIGLLIFLGLWEAVPRLGLVNSALLPGPSAIPPAFMKEVTSGAWPTAVASSLSHYVVGLCVGAGLGVALGIVTGMYRTRKASRPGSCACCVRSPALPGFRLPSSGSGSARRRPSSSSRSACSGSSTSRLMAPCGPWTAIWWRSRRLSGSIPACGASEDPASRCHARHSGRPAHSSRAGVDGCRGRRDFWRERLGPAHDAGVQPFGH